MKQHGKLKYLKIKTKMTVNVYYEGECYSFLSEEEN